MQHLCTHCDTWRPAKAFRDGTRNCNMCAECREAAKLERDIARNALRGRVPHDPEPRTRAEYRERCAAIEAQQQRDFDRLAATTREVLGR